MMEELYTFIGKAFAPVSAVLLAWYTALGNKKKKNKEILEAEEREKEAKRQETLETILSMVQDIDSRLANVSNANLAQLKSILVDKHTVLMERQWVTLFEKADIMSLHEQYKILGGNSFVEDLVEEMLALTVVTSKMLEHK